MVKTTKQKDGYNRNITEHKKMLLSNTEHKHDLL